MPTESSDVGICKLGARGMASTTARIAMSDPQILPQSNVRELNCLPASLLSLIAYGARMRTAALLLSFLKRKADYVSVSLTFPGPTTTNALRS